MKMLSKSRRCRFLRFVHFYAFSTFNFKSLYLTYKKKKNQNHISDFVADFAGFAHIYGWNPVKYLYNNQWNVRWQINTVSAHPCAAISIKNTNSGLAGIEAQRGCLNLYPARAQAGSVTIAHAHHQQRPTADKETEAVRKIRGCACSVYSFRSYLLSCAYSICALYLSMIGSVIIGEPSR